MRRTFLAMACAIAVLSACSGTPASATRINVGYTNTASFLGLFVAKHEGMFSKRGLDVNPVLIALNPTVPSALVGGSIQIGGATPSVMLAAVDAGIDVVAVGGAAVNDIHHATGGVLARTGVAIATPKDFEGRRVGVPGIGAYMHVLFRRWLTERGADDKAVNFVEVPLAQGSDILKAGNVDAILVGEPFYSRVLAAKTGYLVARYLADMPDGLLSMYYASNRAWAEQNPKVLESFRQALEEAAQFVASNPDKARAIMGEAMKLPPDVVATMVLPTFEVRVPESDVRYWAETLLSQGLIRKLPDTHKLVVD